MTMLVIQTLLLLLIAYILGAIIGCLLHQWFAADAKEEPAIPAAAVAAPRVTPPPPPPMPAPAPIAAVSARPARATKSKPATKKKAPAAKPAPKPAGKPASKDDLKRIRGIGRQNEARLNAAGVTTFAEIAAWSKKDQAEWGDKLAFPGRIEREEWVKQAKVLARGGATEFSKRVARGEVETSTGKGSVGDLGTKPSTLGKPRGGKGDNLTLIDGIGNAIEKKLNALGIWHFEQIARWTAANQVWIGNQIGFPGRAERENWVGEAKILGAGGMTDHARKVEQGRIETSRKSKPGENK